MNIEACFIVEFRKHPSLFTSCVIIIWIFRQTLQFGVDIRFINRQFFFSLSQPFIRVVIATVLVSLFLRKVEWKSVSPSCDVGLSLCDLQTVSQVHSLRLCCVLAK